MRADHLVDRTRQRSFRVRQDHFVPENHPDHQDHQGLHLGHRQGHLARRGDQQSLADHRHWRRPARPDDRRTLVGLHPGLQVVRLLARLRVLRPDAAASSRGWDEVRPLPAGDPYRSRN